MHSLSIKVE